MQTFILSTNISQSAMWLDNQRLNKQVTEAMQIYRANFENGAKQGNPYAYTMWLNHPSLLIEYGAIHYREWQRRLKVGLRGGKMIHKSGDEFIRLGDCLEVQPREDINPAWLTEEFASDHRSVILGKINEAVDIADLDTSKLIHIYPVDELRKAKEKLERALKVAEWYHQFNWSEQPAKRVLINGKMRWPYLWPEVV